jgi:hypothetical protein
MAFQPFGFQFDLTSHLPPSEAKAAIRSHKKRWLDPKNGARGWIVGPFICLWWTVWRSRGPMLFGRIEEDGAGSRIAGRAGSDHNGIAMTLIVSVAIIPLIWGMVASSRASAIGTGAIAIVFVVALALTLGMASADRKGAEPLVRFLEKTVTKQGKTRRKASTLPVVATGLTLSVNEEMGDGPLTSDAILDALADLGVDDFAVLASAHERYLQTLSTSKGWILEKREGDGLQHFRAQRSDGAKTFDLDEVLAVFLAYASDAPMPAVVKWQTLQL